jgi:hypothetical protein
MNGIDLDEDGQWPIGQFRAGWCGRCVVNDQDAVESAGLFIAGERGEQIAFAQADSDRGCIARVGKQRPEMREVG